MQTSVHARLGFVGVSTSDARWSAASAFGARGPEAGQRGNARWGSG